MAHGFLQSFNKDLEVYSAGTKPAECINPKAVEAMSEVDIDITTSYNSSNSKFRWLGGSKATI